MTYRDLCMNTIYMDFACFTSHTRNSYINFVTVVSDGVNSYINIRPELSYTIDLHMMLKFVCIARVFVIVLLIVSISFVGLAICLIIIFVGIGCARRSVYSFTQAIKCCEVIRLLLLLLLMLLLCYLSLEVLVGPLARVLVSRDACCKLL